MPAPEGHPKVIGKVFYGFKHLSGNVLCAIDTETTGLDPEVSGIIEVAIIPLTHMIEPHPKIPLFNMKMIPDDGETIEMDAIRVNKAELSQIILSGNTRDRVCDYLIKWFDSLNLAPGKRLIPLAHNWPFDRAMLLKWLGKSTFEYIFHYHYRDTMMICNYLNDFADSRGEKIPHDKLTLRGCCNIHQVELLDAHSAISDALACSQLFRALVKRGPTEYIN